MLKRKIDSRGDSLVEVMLAIAVLSFSIATAWATVNRALQINLTARQRVVMVNALKEQAEILNAHYAASSLRPLVLGSGTISSVNSANITSSIPVNPCGNMQSDGSVTPSQAFYFNDNAQITSGVKNSVGNYQESYAWIQRADGAGYVDFYIRACWRTTGGAETLDSSHFIVRLNR